MAIKFEEACLKESVPGIGDIKSIEPEFHFINLKREKHYMTVLMLADVKPIDINRLVQLLATGTGATVHCATYSGVKTDSSKTKTYTFTDIIKHFIRQWLK